MYKEIATIDCRDAGRISVVVYAGKVSLHMSAGVGSAGPMTTAMMPAATARAIMAALGVGAEAAEANAAEVARKYADAKPARPALGVA